MGKNVFYAYIICLFHETFSNISSNVQRVVRANIILDGSEASVSLYPGKLPPPPPHAIMFFGLVSNVL